MKFQPLFLPTRLKLLPTRSHLGVPLGNEHRTVPRFTANEWNNFLPIGKLTFLPTEISGFLFSKWKAPINAKLIRVIENLYKTASAVYFNGGSQWGGGFYGYRLKFWLFYRYRLIFFSYG